MENNYYYYIHCIHVAYEVVYGLTNRAGYGQAVGGVKWQTVAMPYDVAGLGGHVQREADR